MRVTLVHNTKAGGESPATRRLKAMIAKAGHDVHHHAGGRRGLEQAVSRPADLVVAAGGDGTVRDVALALAGSGVPMAILPLGTANNVARSLGGFAPLDELVRGWEGASVRRIDLGRVTGGIAGLFIEAVGGGLLSRLVEDGAGQEQPGGDWIPGSEVDRAVLELRGLLRRAEPRPWGITLDGRDLSGEYLLVEALNVPLVGPNLPLAPRADPADGQLDLVVVGEAQRPRLDAYLESRLRGRPVEPGIEAHRGSRIDLVAPPGCLHVDDEPVPGDSGEPVHALVTVERGAVGVLAPPGAIS